MTDWNDIGSICRTFGNGQATIQRLERVLADQPCHGRNFWEEAADEIERLRALVTAHTPADGGKP